MERVILNVVGNAIKFTPDEGAIRVWMEPDALHPQQVVICCEDTGIGIPRESLPRVTERYFTVGDQPSGSGLGLAISKEIVHLHGGRLELQSPPPEASQGTRVTVVLPTVEPPLVLIVDDDPGVTGLLRRQVVSEGYRVETAAGGRAALSAIREHKPQLVLLDVALPELDGTEIILQMKSEPGLSRIPVVVVSGAPLNVAQTEILSSFSIATLPKPWQEADLTEALSSVFLGSGSLSRQPLPEESRGKAVPVPTRVADSRREAADNVNKE
jgi:CheY-like chemotaxis protein